MAFIIDAPELAEDLQKGDLFFAESYAERLIKKLHLANMGLAEGCCLEGTDNEEYRVRVQSRMAPAECIFDIFYEAKNQTKVKIKVSSDYFFDSYLERTLKEILEERISGENQTNKKKSPQHIPL